MHLLITGSNAKLLSGELATHLTGRYMQTELFPFSFAEYCGYKKIDTNHSTTKEKGLLQAAFSEYLKEGGFPELLEETRKQSYINTLVNNILINDIEKRYSIKYKAAFEQLANHLLNNAPSSINYKDLQQTFGLKSDHTAENYVSYCKNAYLVCGLHKYSAKSKIRIRDEKAYAVDVALMNNRQNSFAGENLGWRLETIVFIELLRRYRNQGFDIYYYKQNFFAKFFKLCENLKYLRKSSGLTQHQVSTELHVVVMPVSICRCGITAKVQVLEYKLTFCICHLHISTISVLICKSELLCVSTSCCS